MVDEHIFQYILNREKSKLSSYDLREGSSCYRLLRKHLFKMKCKLCSNTQQPIQSVSETIEFPDDTDLTLTLSQREITDDLQELLFKELHALITSCLESLQRTNQIQIKDIELVLTTGAMSRLLIFRKILSYLFGKGFFLFSLF